MQTFEPEYFDAMFRSRLRLAVRMYPGTIDDLARKARVPKPTIETAIYGQSLPGIGTVARLVPALGVTADWLLFGAEAGVRFDQRAQS